METKVILYILETQRPFRSFDYYIPEKFTKEQLVHTNRGVSGIEGFISSTIGASIKSNRNIDLFIGDISFIHDINALFNLNKVTNTVRIFILNNKSGGIFKNLPLVGLDESIKLLTTPHNYNFEGICKDAGIIYKKITSKKSFVDECLNETQGHRVIECIINEEDNLMLFKELQTIDY